MLFVQRLPTKVRWNVPSSRGRWPFGRMWDQSPGWLNCSLGYCSQAWPTSELFLFPSFRAKNSEAADQKTTGKRGVPLDRKKLSERTILRLFWYGGVNLFVGFQKTTENLQNAVALFRTFLLWCRFLVITRTHCALCISAADTMMFTKAGIRQAVPFHECHPWS